MVFRSKEFDDIYFSAQDGLEETRHVFLAGNNLPAAWAGRPHFVIAETGFGTGLNFLAAWQLFARTAQPGQKLHYISFEKFPLNWVEIESALAQWRGELGPQMDVLRAVYPLRTTGFHRVVLNDQVTLTLIFDDVNGALPRLDVPCGVDAWFLDGFAPAKNPQMWTDTLFTNMARLSRPGATFATFTAAGIVKRGLSQAGFTVDKIAGFGRKRDMLAGRFNGTENKTEIVTNKKIAIIGGGLAGTATAHVLKAHGHHSVIFEKGATLASGASGNSIGLYNPRLSAQRTADSDFYASAFAHSVRTLSNLPDVSFNRCGSLHLATDAEKQKRFNGAASSWGWHVDHLHLADQAETSSIAGVNVPFNALYLPDGGTVNPSALCHALARDIDMRLNATLDDYTSFDAVILCNGIATKETIPDLLLQAVRGQISLAQQTPFSAQLKSNLCFGGYLSPAQNGIHGLGATFQQWLSDTDVKDEDHAQNLKKLTDLMPEFAGLKITGGRTSLRTASQDRFPVIGHVSDNIYVSTAHGSHGIISALAGAHLLADIIGNGPRSLPRDTIALLAASRFAERARKKQG